MKKGFEQGNSPSMSAVLGVSVALTTKGHKQECEEREQDVDETGRKKEQ